MALIIPAAILKQMKAVPKADQVRIIEAPQLVAHNPAMRMNFVTEIAGEPGLWRLRKGDWRAIFVIEGTDLVVTRVGNRREIYR